MVKKSYVAPASDEARTRLRASLLAGSIGSNPSGPGNTGRVPVTDGDPIDNGQGGIGDARRRSVSSVD